MALLHVNGQRPEPTPARTRRAVEPRTVMIVASLGVFMAFVDTTIVTIAFPNMLESFPGAGLSDLSWVFNVYNIALAALIVPAGRFADLLGRRRTFAAGVLLFTAASALCAAAPSVAVLVAARALQGAGAAIILPASLGLILEAYPPARRRHAVALWTATGALAAGIGPSLGGGLVVVSDWRLVFLVNVPIGLVVWRIANRRLVESRAPGRRALPDMVGAVLLGVAFAALTLAIVQAEAWGWLGWETIVAFLASGVAAAWLVRRCRSHPSPIVDLGLLGSRQVAVAGVLTLFGGAAFFAVSLANVLYLIEVWGYSPLVAGLAATPAPLLAAVVAVLTARLVAGRDPRPFIVAGAIPWLLGPLYLIEHFSSDPHYLTGYLPGAALLAIGAGSTVPLVGAIAVANAPGGRFAGATAFNSSIRQFAAALGVAALVVLVGQPSPAETEAAFTRAWLFGAIGFGLVGVGALGLGRAHAQAPVDELADEVRDRVRARTASTAATPPRRPATPPVTRASAPRPTPDVLADVPLFASLDAAAREEIAVESTAISVGAGEWLFRQGDAADALYVVLSGRVHIVDETSGAVLRKLAIGAVMGEMGLIGGSHRTAGALVRRDARLLRVGREQFERVMEDSPAVSRDVMRRLGTWLTDGRPEPSHAAGSATIAVVPLDEGAAAAELYAPLAAALGRLGSVWLVGPTAVAGDPDPGHALSTMLDRLETDYRHVVLVAGVPGRGDAWTDGCIRQADRVVVVVEDVAAVPDPTVLPDGCELVMLGAPGAPGTDVLLDALAPRATYRVRPGTRRRDIAALARRLAGRSVGLVLSGGGARSFAQIGVLEELHAAGVEIDRVAGSSMGAFIGALLAQGLEPDEIDARVYEEWVRRNPLADYRLSRFSLARGDRMRMMLERNLPGAIEDLQRGYFCVSVDLASGQVVEHRRGSLPEAVGASMAVPVLLPPTVAGQRVLLDGGLVDNLPTEAMAADGEGLIVAVDCAKPSFTDPSGAAPAVPTLMETIFKVTLLAGSQRDPHAYADVLVRPDDEGVGVLEFHMLDRMRDVGRRAAVEALERAPDSVFG